MEKKENAFELKLSPPGSGFLGFGDGQAIPLFAKLSAQVQIAMDQNDLSLAQKATDIAIREGGIDLKNILSWFCSQK